MRARRTVDLISHFKGVLDDVFSQAAIYKLSHARILDLRGERVLRTPEWGRMPRHAQAEVYGYNDALFRFHERTQLEWRMMFRGELRTEDEIPDGCWHEIVSEDSRHTYKGRPDKIY